MGGRGPDAIGRVAIQGLGSPSWQLGSTDEAAAEKQILQSMLHIKALVRAAKCAAYVTIPAGANLSSISLYNAICAAACPCMCVAIVFSCKHLGVFWHSPL